MLSPNDLRQAAFVVIASTHITSAGLADRLLAEAERIEAQTAANATDEPQWT